MLALRAQFWFCVKYGGEQEQLFNMDCWGAVLIDHIKEKCGYGNLSEAIDLQREADGSMANLHKVGTNSASTVLQPKAKYFLCKLTQNEDGSAGGVEKLWYKNEAAGGEGDESAEAEPEVAAKGKKK